MPSDQPTRSQFEEWARELERDGIPVGFYCVYCHHWCVLFDLDETQFRVVHAPPLCTEFRLMTAEEFVRHHPDAADFVRSLIKEPVT